METQSLLVWPDYTWELAENIDDIDWYLCTTGKSDDYSMYDIPLELDEEDIEELVQLKSLPGMLKKENVFPSSKSTLPKDSILILEFPVEQTPFITKLDGKMIINCDTASLEILKGK